MRLFIGTTVVPVEVLRITKEDPQTRSTVCLNGTTDEAGIAFDYSKFVAQGTGVIAKRFGHPSYRVDMDGHIDQDKSWQLGFFLAHAAVAAGIPIGPHADGPLILATGTVDQNLQVGGVANVADKIHLAREYLFASGHAAETKAFVVVPAENAEEAREAIQEETVGDREPIELILANDTDCLNNLFDLRAEPVSANRPRRPLLVVGLTAFSAAIGSVMLLSTMGVLPFPRQPIHPSAAETPASQAASTPDSVERADDAPSEFADGTKEETSAGASGPPGMMPSEAISLQLWELRAPQGMTRHHVALGQAKPLHKRLQADEMDHFPAGGGNEAFSGIRYRVTNDSPRPLLVTVTFAGLQPDAVGRPEGRPPKNQWLAPGEIAEWSLRATRLIRAPIDYSVTITTDPPVPGLPRRYHHRLQND